jgi:hypothetical protein
MIPKLFQSTLSFRVDAIRITKLKTLFNSPVLVGLIRITKNYRKMAKAVAEFRFRRLGKRFWNQGTMIRLRYVRHCTYQRYGTTGGIKQMGRAID